MFETLQMYSVKSILRRISFVVVGTVAAVGQCASMAIAQNVDKADITIFAAASLKNALDAVAADYQAGNGSKVTISYGASSALAKQLEQAAPADIFISADLDWMDYVAKKDLINSATRKNLLGNTLVLIAPVDSKETLEIAPGFDLAGVLGNGKIAMGDVKAVPAGKYGRAALEKLGVWAAVEPKVAQSENVRAAMALVARGEAALGIVYGTDAISEPKVRIVDAFPSGSHPPIIYPIALTSVTLKEKSASDFLRFLTSASAQAIFTKEGFVSLK